MTASLTQKIKAEARRLGFHLAGVALPTPPDGFRRYRQWVGQGFHGEMDYLARPDAVHKRSHPKEILPECQSILVLGIHYNASPQAQTESGKGRIAAYAWNDDYHDILKPRLLALTAYIEKQSGNLLANRWYTDSGPILERDLARRAGLGWIGKNSMLIHPQAGSFFLLAEIFLSIPLDPDPPLPTDHCGSCTRCIDICPTDCILPDRTLDARRCISYLTIELKGPIPEDLRQPIGDWAFGCDLCQQVCPWNIRFAPPEGDPAFAPRPGIPQIDLLEEINLTPQTFNQKFKGSPVKRAKRRGYLRNVATILGNQKDPAAVPALIQTLKAEPEALIRQHAAWALGQIGGTEARRALKAALEDEQEKPVLREIQAGLDQSFSSPKK